MKRLLRCAELALPLVLLAYAVYASLFIFRTSFVINGERYFSLFDDEMVSMRYARNLAHGHGLVWNPGGERVEGYTNLAWVLYMSLFHLLPIAASKISLLIQVSGALFLLLNLVFVYKIAHVISGASRAVAFGAVLLTAFYLPLNNWSLQGTEVGVLTCIVSAAIWLALQSVTSGRVSSWLYLWLGASTLIRMDMLVPSLAMLIVLATVDRTHRKQHLATGLGTVIALLLAQTLFRLMYYGELLPNTYYLKMTGYPTVFRITRGLSVTWTFIERMTPLLFLMPLALWRFRRDKSVLLLGWAFSAQLLYSIYVGGDAWDWWDGGSNRFVSIVMPLFFVLFTYGLRELVLYVRRKARLTLNWARYGFAALLVCSLVKLNDLNDYGALREWLLLQRTLNVQANVKYVGIGLLLREITTPDARVAVVWAGATPYFSDRYAIDLFGKNDKRIAREPMHLPPDQLTGFYPGHLKWDLNYSIGELQPDVVVRWFGTIPEEMPYGEQYRAIEVQGAKLFVRNGSARILWNKLGGGDRALAARVRLSGDLLDGRRQLR